MHSNVQNIPHSKSYFNSYLCVFRVENLVKQLDGGVRVGGHSNQEQNTKFNRKTSLNCLCCYCPSSLRTAAALKPPTIVDVCAGLIGRCVGEEEIDILPFPTDCLYEQAPSKRRRESFFFFAFCCL